MSVSTTVPNSSNQEQMVTHLREAIDALIASIESGRVGFDYAVKEYVDHHDNALSSAFNGFVEEMELADSQPIYGDNDPIPDFSDKRRTALLNVAKRANISEVTAFTDAMIEAQDKRISVVKALTLQADQLRP